MSLVGTNYETVILYTRVLCEGGSPDFYVNVILDDGFSIIHYEVKKGILLYNAVSSPNRFTLHPPGRPVHSRLLWEAFQPLCSYCAKTIRSHFRHCIHTGTHLYS